MRALVRREMEAGALGIGSSLIYAPAFYATTEELIELCKVAAKYTGKYISHMRSEGDRLIEAVEELIRISREARHAGRDLSPQGGRRGQLAEDGRRSSRWSRRRGASGLQITADMYTYTAGATGLDASMPPWVLDGGYDEAYKRLRDPATRARRSPRRCARRRRTGRTCYLAAGSPDRVLLVEFKTDALKPLTGKTLAEVAKLRGKDPVDTIIEPGARGSLAGRHGLLHDVRGQHHASRSSCRGCRSGRTRRRWRPKARSRSRRRIPRAYGNFARVLGKYVRDEKVMTLAEAMRRLSGLPATNLELDDRGFLKPGHVRRRRRLRSARRSPTARRSRSRTSTPSACATSSSTAPPCCATANTPMPGPGGALRAGQGRAESCPRGAEPSDGVARKSFGRDRSGDFRKETSLLTSCCPVSS